MEVAVLSEAAGPAVLTADVVVPPNVKPVPRTISTLIEMKQLDVDVSTPAFS